MLVRCSGMPAACSWHAGSILGPSSGRSATTFFDALPLRGRIRVVLLPVVNRSISDLADHKAHVDQRRDQRARLAVPVRLELNVVIRQVGQVSGPALLAHPQEQAHERPASVRAQQLLEPLGLAVPAQANRDADVVGHGLTDSAEFLLR